MALSNAQLAQQISELVNYWRTRDVQFAQWLGGTPSGGPYGDGRYPLTDYLGVIQYLYCPAALESSVTSSASSAAAQAALAGASKDAALSAQAAAETARTFADEYKTAAQAARDLTLQYRDEAANSQANALVHRNAAQTARTGAETAEANSEMAQAAAEAARDVAHASASDASSSATAAANSAALAAQFDPADFYTKVAADALFSLLGHTHTAADIVSGTFSTARIPALATSKITSGTFLDARIAATNVTQHQAALSITWAQLTNVPATFTPSGHTHAVADVTGLQTALDGKSATSHTHTFASLTAKPTTLQGYGITNAAALSHTHDYLPLTGGTLTGGLTLSGNTLQSSGKIQAYGWDGQYYNGHAVALGVTGSASYVHSYNAANNTYPKLNIASSDVDFQANSYVRGNGKRMIDTGDTWLRLNQAHEFTSGVHTPGILNVGSHIYSTGGDIYVSGGFRWYGDSAYYIYNMSGYSYGSWRVGGKRNGYVGVALEDGGRMPTFMSSGGQSGIYNQGSGGGYWDYYNDGTNFRMGRRPFQEFDGAGALLRYTAGQTGGRLYIQQGGSPAGSQEGDITLIW